MAAVATHSLLDIQKKVIEFAEGALRELRNDPNQQFQENVEQVAVWANQVAALFNTVVRSFEDMFLRYGAQFRQLGTYLNEWRAYRRRWDRYLSDSCDVASQHITILRRFDQIFLDMVEHIETNQDRLDVIVELQQFTNEDHRDCRITSKPSDISNATIALAVSGRLLNAIGMIVSGSLLASYQAQRTEKERELHRKQLDLAQVNLSQVALAHLNIQIDILRPDIALICDKLLLFSQIWTSVRSQCVQFRGHLEGGVGAETNMRFRMEVRLAREVCLPLMEGLERYSTEIWNRFAMSDSVE